MHPVLFRIFGIEIYTYGVIVAIAFTVGILVAIREGRRYGIHPVKIIDLSFVVIVCGLLGARILFAITEWELFKDAPWNVFKIWEGGFVWYGGFFLCIIASYVYARARKIDFIVLLDTLAPSAAIGLSIGRWACFSAGCCYGKPTDLPIGVVFRDPSSIAPLDIPLHPTQVYSVFANYLIYIMLMASREEKLVERMDIYGVLSYLLFRFYGLDYRFDFILDPVIFIIYIAVFYWLKFVLIRLFYALRERPFKGMGAVIYLFSYSILRSLIEFVRGDPRGSVLFMSTSQFISVFTFGWGIYILLRYRKERADEKGLQR